MQYNKYLEIENNESEEVDELDELFFGDFILKV